MRDYVAGFPNDHHAGLPEAKRFCIGHIVQENWEERGGGVLRMRIASTRRFSHEPKFPYLNPQTLQF
jgi:hypothetical protein